MNEKQYPVPRYLKEIYCVDESVSGEYNLDGRVQCVCGCENFKIRTFSDYNAKRNIVSVGQYEDGYALVVKADCNTCGKEWLLFDLSKHGYDGFVCQDGVAIPDTVELAEYSCVNCRQNSFKVYMGIEVEDKEQFMEEVVAWKPDKFTEEDYVDAFNWLDISLKCSCCGKDEKSWINLELS